MEAQDTEVSKWLSANGAEQFAGAFFEKGWEAKADLTRKIIEGLVTESPGTAAKLARLLETERTEAERDKAALTKAEEAEKAKKRPPIPDLPPGVALDLSMQKIEAPDVPPFTLPTELSVQATNAAIISPLQLSSADWMVVAGNSRFPLWLHNGGG
jgi:hypothetical protein